MKHKLLGWTDNPKPLVYTLTAKNSATLYEKGEVDLQQPWNDLNPYPVVGTSIIYTVVLQSQIGVLQSKKQAKTSTTLGSELQDISL